MQVIYNGADKETSESCSLQEYLEKEGLENKPGIAVAVNETVIPKNEWAARFLKSNDSIIVIKATQGG
jgi:sulfur carrier protein